MRVMKTLALLLAFLIALPAAAAAAAAAAASEATAGERLGTVSFPVSCSASERAQFVRGVALLHDFWYQEAQRQFEQIAKSDPDCAMAHWGIAMSLFHEIWERPGESAMTQGWREMHAAQAHPAKTAREREYVAALSSFFRPDKRDYRARIEDYAAAMAKLY